MATRSRGGEYPVCLIAVRDGVQPPAAITNISPTAKCPETPNGQNSTKVASLQDFTSHIGCSGVIVDHQKGLVLSSLLPFSEFLQNGQRQASGSGAENFQNILKTLSVSVIIQSPKSDSALHSRHSQLISFESNLHRNKTLVQQVAGLATDPTDPFRGRWTDGDGNVWANGDGEEPLVYGARVALAWQCHTLDDELRRLLPKEDGWTVDYAEKNDEMGSGMRHGGRSGSRRCSDDGGGNEGEGEGSSDADGAEFVSWFVLLQVDGTLPATEDLRLVSDIRAGQPVTACGTPFATLCPSIFLNSLSTGIITKISGPVLGSSPGVGSLVMTDARCMPGMEGGGLFVEDRGQSCLAAIIISPLCWKSNELVGLTLACSISALLQSLSREDCGRVGGGSGVSDLRDVIEHRSLTSDAAGGIRWSGASDPWRRTATESSRGSASDDVSLCLGSVVLLRVGTVWGSGVIVHGSQGLVLTCRHVVKNATMKRVSAKIPSQPWMRAEVVFMTPDPSPFDLALLRMIDVPKQSSAIRDVPMASVCHEGSRVYAVGYPLFDPGKTTDPAITSGVVSKVVRLDGQPVMLQSSCAVLPGASGGALVCAETGRLLGIIASNSKDVESGASFPHVNFSIPVNCFRGALDDFIRSGDPSCFQRLVTSNQRLAHIWALRERGAYRLTMRSKL